MLSNQVLITLFSHASKSISSAIFFSSSLITSSFLFWYQLSLSLGKTISLIFDNKSRSLLFLDRSLLIPSITASSICSHESCKAKHLNKWSKSSDISFLHKMQWSLLYRSSFHFFSSLSVRRLFIKHLICMIRYLLSFIDKQFIFLCFLILCYSLF